MEKLLEIRLLCVEDGLDNVGFRKISAYIKSIHSNTKVAYVPVGNLRSPINLLTEGGSGEFKEKDIDNVSEFLAEGDLVGLSSMTQYSNTVYKIIAKIRQINPSAYIVWGGYIPLSNPKMQSNMLMLFVQVKENLHLKLFWTFLKIKKIIQPLQVFGFAKITE